MFSIQIWKCTVSLFAFLVEHHWIPPIHFFQNKKRKEKFIFQFFLTLFLFFHKLSLVAIKKRRISRFSLSYYVLILNASPLIPSFIIRSRCNQSYPSYHRFTKGRKEASIPLIPQSSHVAHLFRLPRGIGDFYGSINGVCDDTLVADSTEPSSIYPIPLCSTIS